MSSIAANLEAVRRRIAAALPGAPREVVIVAVAKQRAPEAIRAAAAAGCTDIGESYAQEALPKVAALAGAGLRWHFIGHVQTNKAREIASKFDWVHAVDRVKVAAALDRARPDSLAPLDVCVQVNISAEATKGGVAPPAALALCREVAAMPRLRLRGLMGMAAPSADVTIQRAQFASLRLAFDEVRDTGLDLDTLSMGMSDDFEAAVAEGATMVRIGSAIFGARNPLPGPLPRERESRS